MQLPVYIAYDLACLEKHVDAGVSELKQRERCKFTWWIINWYGEVVGIRSAIQASNTLSTDRHLYAGVHAPSQKNTDVFCRFLRKRMLTHKAQIATYRFSMPLCLIGSLVKPTYSIHRDTV